jgi:hypothetical protein
VIRIRPASEHDGRTPAIWLYYRTDEAGVPQREYVGTYGLNLQSEFLYWFPLPELADPETVNPLPYIRVYKVNARGERAKGARGKELE